MINMFMYDLILITHATGQIIYHDHYVNINFDLDQLHIMDYR